MESVNETYAHYADQDDDEDSLDDNGRKVKKPMHTLSRPGPAPTTTPTHEGKDVRKDQKGRGNHGQQQQCEPTKSDKYEAGSSGTPCFGPFGGGFSISCGKSPAGKSPEGLQCSG